MNIFEVFHSDHVNANTFFDSLLSSFNSFNNCKKSIDKFFEVEKFDCKYSFLVFHHCLEQATETAWTDIADKYDNLQDLIFTYFFGKFL